MELIEGEVDEGTLLVSDIGAEILAADNVPAVTLPPVQLLLYYTCYFAILLGLGYASHVCNFLDGRVGDADDVALFLGIHIGHPDQYFLMGLLRLVLVF